MAKKKKKSQQPIKHSKLAPQQQQQQRIDYYQGDRLDNLLHKLGRGIEESKLSKGDLPDKIWMKQHFAIGVNEVTRVLERMARAEVGVLSAEEIVKSSGRLRTAPLIPLQAVILASDVNPRMLTKHVPNLASSRQVPVIFIKDNIGGSLRLGELVKLKTTMAIGVKAVILASDVNPRMLTKHVPDLAYSRQVPVIFIKDNRGGSLRLGELVKLKTTMAIGVKATDSVVNKTIDELLLSDPLVVDTPMVQETTTVAH